MQLLGGLVMALAAILLVLEPLLRAASGRPVAVAQPLFEDSDDEDDPRLARRDRALAALKEIDFDRATGKLSDDDFAKLKAQFTEEALAALRLADAVAPAGAEAEVSPDTPAAGGRRSDRREDDVERLVASARRGGNGGTSGRRFCIDCGAPLEAQRRFCVECGAPVASIGRGSV